MDAFIQLRKRAAEKRDRAYKQARDEYKLAITRIAELEQLINGTHIPGRVTTAKAIESVIPEDRPFTSLDIRAGLVALNPDREWRQRAIDNQLYLLKKKGVIRRLRAAGNRRHALFVRNDVDIPPLPFENMRLVDVIAAVLARSAKPMTQTELTVAMLEQGYETDQSKVFLRNHVGNTMKTNPGRFRRQSAGRWTTADQN